MSEEQVKLFHDGGHYHIETSPLICSANQWTGFYMITASVMKGLRQNSFSVICMTQWRNSTAHCVNELYSIFVISIFLSSRILQTK